MKRTVYIVYELKSDGRKVKIKQMNNKDKALNEAIRLRKHNPDKNIRVQPTEVDIPWTSR